MADWWTTYPWRCIQTNLREIDMRDISASLVVADMKSFDATVLMINAAGIIASYPTKLPFHFQSPYLTGDSLKDIITACHDAGIRLIARTDFSKIRRPIYEMHPDWAYRTKDGDIVDYNGDVHACVNGPYQQERMFDILKELFEEHDFDGIFFNMGGYQTRDYSGNYHGICHCESCRRKFHGVYGCALPAREDRNDPVFRKYAVFKRDTMTALARRVNEFLTNLKPDLCIAGNTVARRGFIRQESNTAVDRPLPRWQYSGSDNTKWATSSFPEMVSSNTTVDFIDIPYRHVTVSPAQQHLRLAQGLANGGALDWYLIGRIDNHEDRSGFAPVRDVFAYHAAHEREYAGLTSRARIALVRGSHQEYRGWFRMLTENHFPFDSLRTDAALDVPWDRYDALILPDLASVSDELAQRIDAFVNDGGTLLATGRTAFRDRDDEDRQGCGILSLGIAKIERVEPRMRSAYFKVMDKAGWSRLGDADLLYLDGPYVFAEYTGTAASCLRLIPPHHYGPPERCYYELVVDRPGFVVNTYGKGTAIYVPWMPGALFHKQGFTNTSDFAADLLENVAGLGRVGGNLSPMCEVTLYENNDGAHLVHVVNTSGHFGNSFYEPVPMRDVEIEIPLEKQPASVRLLRAGGECSHAYQNGVLRLVIPRIDLFEAVLIT